MASPAKPAHGSEVPTRGDDGTSPASATEHSNEQDTPLVIDQLVKKYGQRIVLDGIDISIHRSETLVVIGGSGAGKSTLVRHLIGLERPTAGRILVDGVDITTLGDFELSKLRRKFGMVFQKYALFDSMTVYDNVAFPLREQTRLSEKQIRERVMTKLQELHVEHAAKRMPSEISGGMAKRVGIARALVLEPEILIYDEPTSGLDPVTSRTVDELIEEMRETFAITSIVITHDMTSAFDVADRVAMLVRGKVVVEGPPEAVLASDNEDVRKFVDASAVDPARLENRKRRKKAHELRETFAARRAKS